MGSLYEELGAKPSDSHEVLRRRYRQRARELHPDVNRDPQAEDAMRSLNRAWAVLGDPLAREAYDDSLVEPSPVPAAAVPPSDDQPPALEAEAIPWHWRLLRPSVLIPVVLLIIFIGTAYAGHPGPNASTPAPARVPALSPPPLLSPAVLMDRCVAQVGSGLVIVPCAQLNDGEVTSEISLSGRCPAGTTAAVIPGAALAACLTPVDP